MGIFKRSPRPAQQPAEELSAFVELPIPPGQKYIHKDTGAFYQPVTVSSDLVVTAFPITMSGTWNYRRCTISGGAGIFPEGQPIYMFLGDFLKEFVLLENTLDRT